MLKKQLLTILVEVEKRAEAIQTKLSVEYELSSHPSAFFAEGRQNECSLSLLEEVRNSILVHTEFVEGYDEQPELS